MGSVSHRQRHCLKPVLLVRIDSLLGAPRADNGAVYALDRLPEPSPDFHKIAERATKEFGTSLEYRQIDVREVEQLGKIVEDIANKHGRLDGLIAAAGIQQETSALEYTAADANRMFEVNITGVFMTSQAVAKQMIKFGKGGSIVMIASMSGSVANKVLTSFNSRVRLLMRSRVSSVLRTTRRRRACSNWVATSPWSGASTASGSTPSRRATL